MAYETFVDRIIARANEPTNREYAVLIHNDGSRESLTYSHLINMAHHAATWLNDNLPPRKSASDFSTFLYVGDVTLRRVALVIAAAMTRRTILLVRRYAPAEALTHLISATGCNIVLYESPTEERAEGSDGAGMHLVLPDWSSWYSSPRPPTSVPSVGYGMCDPVCIFHTSGTTGNPKPIVFTHEKLMSFSSIAYVGREIGVEGKKMISSFPSAHLGGMMISLFWPVFLGIIPVLQRTGVTNTLDQVSELMQHADFTLLAAQPSMLSSLSGSNVALARIRKLTCVLTGSAPLDHALVDRLQADGGTTVLNLYGATETLPLRQDFSQRHEWPYISFKADSGVDFYHTMDDLYELVVDKDTGTDHTPSVFYTFPDQHTFRSGDLFTAHPRKPGLWRFSGRKDDMISLANGQAVHVGLVESIIRECHDVEAAIVGEDGRPTIIVLIVPRKGATEDQGAVRKLQCALQPFLDRANAKSPPAAHIQKDMVLILPCRDEIASVTDKGTLMRARLFQEFKERIDQSYLTARRN